MNGLHAVAWKDQRTEEGSEKKLSAAALADWKSGRELGLGADLLECFPDVFVGRRNSSLRGLGIRTTGEIGDFPRRQTHSMMECREMESS